MKKFDEINSAKELFERCVDRNGEYYLECGKYLSIASKYMTTFPCSNTCIPVRVRYSSIQGSSTKTMYIEK